MSSLSWTRAYRLTLHLLPAGLRRKHGPAMEALFARELGRARARGRLRGALAGAAGVWDVVRRGAYERVRPAQDAAAERHAGPSGDTRGSDAHGAPPAGAHRDGPRVGGARADGPRLPQPTTRALLRRHATAFALAFAALTAALLALFARRHLPALSARGVPAGTLAEVLVLAVPFIAAMTVPVAVLVAVVHEFTRLRTDGTLATAARRRGVPRLVGPVLAAALAVAAVTLGWNTEVLPRANARLAAVLDGGVAAPSGRTMTNDELRAAARDARASAGPHARAVAAAYEVEVQKKYALAAACVVLALAGVAIPLRVPRRRARHGGAGMVLVASGAVIGAYYVALITGEELAERLVVPPVVGMWGANALVLAAALLVVRRQRAPLAAGRPS